MEIQFMEKHRFIIIFCGLMMVNCKEVVRNEDICGFHNGRRLYLDLGEEGILYAKNVSFIKSPLRQQTSRVYVTNSSHDQCSLELVTCPSCAITVTFKSLALPHSCGDGGMMMIDSPCRCDYVWISEPPYEDISGAPYCGLYAPITYRSSTRTVSITLFYSQLHQHAFTIEYTAERNRLNLKGSDTMMKKGMNGTAGGIITSPFFPARYPRDLGLEYIINCPTEAPFCRVRVLFSDFQLATVSIIEFYDWNGQRLDVSSGARFRPPIIVSSGPSLLIRFYANGGTGLGYKAFYSYVIGHLYDKTTQPITDCGGYVENLGGTITMIDMVGQGVKTYDCVWLIRPPKNFLHMKTHMYLKVITFADMAGNTELTIRQGPTSVLSPLEMLRHPVSQMQPLRLKEHIAPVSSGFHVSLRGSFGATSRLAIAYAAFGFMDCFSGSDFLCQNHRCIQSQLNCDGFDHCGDNSDEPATCFRDWGIEPRERKWHMNKANYYFPKIDRYPDLKTATLVFVASSLGLIILISALIILLYRMGSRARQQRELQSRLQTISELLDGTVFDIADNARIDEITVSDDPPVYEAPPGYDEVVKIRLEHEGIRRKKWLNAQRDIRRSTPNQQTRDLERTSSLPVPVVDVARNHETAVIPTNPPQIPESPPPPYVTPPGTLSRNHEITRFSRDVAHSSMLPINRNHRRRRLWPHNVEFSRSFPNSENSSPQITTMDTDEIGQYLRNVTSMNAVMSTDSQPRKSNSVGQSTSREYDEESTINREHVRPLHEIIDHQDPRVRSQEDNCTCEGACGCANNDIELIDEEYRRKRTILKLLKSGKSGIQNLNVNLTTTTVCEVRPISQPSSLFNSNDISNYSGDSDFTVTTPCYTPDYRLEDEFQVITEVASVLDTDISRMSITPDLCLRRNRSDSSNTRMSNRQLTRKNINYDFGSLYESIKALDNFLAIHEANYDGDSKFYSATTTLFGTPIKYRRRRSCGSNHAGLFNCIRGWKSTDETVST